MEIMRDHTVSHDDVQIRGMIRTNNARLRPGNTALTQNTISNSRKINEYARPPSFKLEHFWKCPLVSQKQPKCGKQNQEGANCIQKEKKPPDFT
jgi:hypothetical protein